MLFGHLPRQPYGVAPVPEEIAPFYTAGRYIPAPLDVLSEETEIWIRGQR
jgi:uncharacterized protein (DUF885 family)